MEGVSQEDLARDAAAIEQLMETVLMKEKQETEKAKVGRGVHVPTACCIRKIPHPLGRFKKARFPRQRGCQDPKAIFGTTSVFAGE